MSKDVFGITLQRSLVDSGGADNAMRRMHPLEEVEVQISAPDSCGGDMVLYRSLRNQIDSKRIWVIPLSAN